VIVCEGSIAMLKALPILAFIASLASAGFWWMSAKKPLALLDTIQDEMIEAARRNRHAAWAALSAAVFQGLAALQWLLT
jgi:hypothetical protein